MYCSGSNLRLISKLVGHLMIQSASKLDYYVVVLSNSDKRDAAIKLGANEFLIALLYPGTTDYVSDSGGLSDQ